MPPDIFRGIAAWSGWCRTFQIILLSVAGLGPLIMMRTKSVTYDEVTHLPSGYTYLTTGEIRLNPQHPPLIKEICAYPLLFLDVKSPVQSDVLRRSDLPRGYEWAYGREFLFSQDADRILFWGRLPAIGISLGLSIVTMLWASQLWGKWGGILALFLYALDPTITAHAQLVTTDVGCACFSTVFLYCLWKLVKGPSWSRVTLSGLSLGLALGAKFSTVVLIPISALLLGCALFRPYGPSLQENASSAKTRKKWEILLGVPRLLYEGRLVSRAPAAALIFVAILVLAYLTLWAVYFFPSDPFFYSRAMKTVYTDESLNHQFYLMGQLDSKGWWYFLLVAWLVKTPIPSLLLLFAGIGLFLFGKRANWLDEAFVVIPGLAYFVVYSMAARNLGIRYLIPCFPFFFIFAARIAQTMARTRRLAVVAVCLLLTWQAVEFALIAPDHLSYFNEIAGGARRGTEWLDDSNVDWGQGLIQLRAYLRRYQITEYTFCYFGSAVPEYYGVRRRQIPDEQLLQPSKGTFILSAHCVARLRALLRQRYGSKGENWIAAKSPKAIVGHAYYVYEF